MIGLGTQDNLNLAKDFIAKTGTKSFPMLWDKSFESWKQLGITGQPAAIIFDANGNELKRFRGAVTGDQILNAIGK